MKHLLTLLAILITFAAHSQSEFSLYRLNGNLAQANLINPAFYPNHKLVIGLPLISSIYASADNGGISFRDAFRTAENDSLSLDTLSLFNKLKASNRIQFKEAIQLFYFGLRGKRSYFSFGIHQVSESRLNYPGDLIGWAIRGPADQHYNGKPLDIGNFYGRSIAYNKISVNYARNITDKLHLGARFNYLLGVAAGQTSKIGGSVTMSIDSVNINTGSLLGQTAGVDFFKQKNLGASDYVNYLLKTKNKGMGWDFGATYDLNSNVTLSAAVNDIGYISWKEYTRSYQVNPINYTFKGFDLLDYLNQKNNQQFLQKEVDSLKNLFVATETTGGSFKTSLVGKFYAGINFKVLRINNFSALVYFDLFHKRINPALSLGYNLQLGRLLNTTVGITYQDGRINNIGAGIAIKLLNVQIYATSDRANSFLYPARAPRADVHAGVNLVFGKARKVQVDDNDKQEEKEEPQKKEKKKPEPEQKKEIKKDSVPEVVTPVIRPADTTRYVEPVKDQVVPENISQPVAEPVQEEKIEVTPPVIPPPAEPRYEVVKRGTHPDELSVAHYVIVGAFRMKANAQRYSRMLRDEGFENSFGFVTDKDMYYVYVHHASDLEETRNKRDDFRKLSNFQFAESWVLTVE